MILDKLYKLSWGITPPIFSKKEYPMKRQKAPPIKTKEKET
jgi:hypothetical protein